MLTSILTHFEHHRKEKGFETVILTNIKRKGNKFIQHLWIILYRLVRYI